MARIFDPSAGTYMLLDDLDFSQPAQTVQYGINGVSYEIDLSMSHEAELRDCLRPYLRFSHIVGRDTARPREGTEP